MIRCTMYVDGVMREDIPLAEISEIIPDPKNQVWLDLEGESVDQIALLREEFGFHELSLEDCFKAGQRAKIDEYPGYYFLVFYSPALRSDDGDIDAHELHCFVGSNYVVTTHRHPMPALRLAHQRWSQNPAMLNQGVGFLVYTIMDAIIDEYFPLLDHLNDSIEALEDRVLDGDPEATLKEIFRLKKNLLFARRILAPKRDIFNILARRDQPLFSPQTQFYLRDVYDHLIRLLEQVDTQRDMVASLREASISMISNRLNSVMKTLTVIATVLMTLSLIAGIYGMNFDFMPELHWHWGYPAVLGMMAVSGIAMVSYFRRRKWF